MDFGALPPEINSGRMYAGPGPGSMVAAASAWDGLAAELRSAAASYSSVTSGLTGGSWSGSASASMAAAAAPYAAWMSAIAAQAERAATQARAAAGAYEAAFAAHVPPPVVAANRSQLASLISTNIFGQNTAAIAATEAQYAMMWAQDAAAMYRYAGSSASATTVPPFTPPPQTTNPGGPTAQATAVAQATGSAAGAHAQTTLPQLMSQLMSGVPQTLHSLAAPAAPAPTNPLAGLLPTSLSSLAADVELIPKLIVPANDILITLILSLVIPGRVLSTAVPLAAAAAASESGALAAGLGSTTHVLGATSVAGADAAAPAVSAGVGRAGVIGALSVPPSWAAATPAVRLAATVLQGTSVSSAPVVVADASESLLGPMALASVAGSALGNTGSRAIGGTVARVGRPITNHDNQTPDKLKRVLAELSQKPESVQHWHTDQAQLDGLLAQLSKKPGVHAVHVSNKGKTNPGSPTSQSR
jgi:PPE-repeat protein